ncbi:MAG: hypothetical protein FD153_1484 [Rhodospirillaceae bacterium]|nr:MAG: hypothetical protein FD153_1484 [Rhodospirillaceae bacterium]
MALKDDVKAEIQAGRGISPSVIAATLSQTLTAVNAAVRELEMDYVVYRFGDWALLCNAIQGGNPSSPGGIVSTPPTGKYKVTNIYVDPTTGKAVVKYDDTPA